MDYSRFITEQSRRRKPDLIREIATLRAFKPNPDLVFLAVGSPNNGTFPYTDISFKIKDGTEIKLGSEEMMAALHYGSTIGYPPLLKELKQHIKKFHSPPCWEFTDVLVNCGNLDSLSKAIQMMLNPNDIFVTQEPLYTGALNIISPYDPKIIPVTCDNNGMDPKFLRSALSNWDPKEIRDEQGGVPKILYVNPNGGNPTGTTLTEERKREIYQIASEYNLIILEDDPYYFLQFSDMEDFVPSFLSMDVDGRVIRFDSFTSLISPGFRLGFATGPKVLIDKMELHQQSNFCHASCLSQIVVYKTLQYWSHEGLTKHVIHLRNIYEKRRDIMITAAKKYLADLCDWFNPSSGMFFWIKVRDIVDTNDMILKCGNKKKVILLPGRIFMTNPEIPSPYLRVSYSEASLEEIEKGFEYLSELIKEEIILQKARK